MKKEELAEIALENPDVARALEDPEFLAIQKAADEGKSYTLKLSAPITLADGEQLEELEFRPFRFSDADELPLAKDAWTIGHFRKMAVALSGQPPKVIGRVRGGDYERVCQVILVFMRSCPETGGQP